MKRPNRQIGMTDDTAFERNAPAVVNDVMNIAPEALRCTQLIRLSSGVLSGSSTADCRGEGGGRTGKGIAGSRSAGKGQASD